MEEIKQILKKATALKKQKEKEQKMDTEFEKIISTWMEHTGIKQI